MSQVYGYCCCAVICNPYLIQGESKTIWWFSLPRDPASEGKSFEDLGETEACRSVYTVDGWAPCILATLYFKNHHMNPYDFIVCQKVLKSCSHSMENPMSVQFLDFVFNLWRAWSKDNRPGPYHSKPRVLNGVEIPEAFRFMHRGKKPSDWLRQILGYLIGLGQGWDHPSSYP